MDYERDLALRELLHDLGWLPSDLRCDEKKRLAEEYLKATAVWFDAGKGLWLTILEPLRQGYTGLQKEAWRIGKSKSLVPAIDEARRKAAQTRLALEAHIAAHHC
jgi:hypothetical protein